MKKIIALLLAILMLAGVSALAEEAPAVQETYYAFDLDFCPEGYETQPNEEDPESLQVCFFPASADAPVYYLSVSYAEEAGNTTMPVKAELTVEAYQDMQNQFAVNYNRPEFFYYDQTDKNGEGVGVMIIHETDIESGDVGEIISLWHGYMANIAMVKSNALTEEDYRTGLQIIQELKVSEAQDLPYNLIYVESVGTMDMEEGIDREIYCVDGYLGALDFSHGEADLRYVGFEQDDFVRLTLADDAVIVVPTDMMELNEYAPLENPEAFFNWVDTLPDEFREMLYFTYELNENDDVVKIEYCYIP